MFKRMAVAALVMGAALTVLPAGAFAQERFDYGWHDRDFQRREFREHIRHEERVRAWHEREWREHERREHERREIRREYRYDRGGWR